MAEKKTESSGSEKRKYNKVLTTKVDYLETRIVGLVREVHTLKSQLRILRDQVGIKREKIEFDEEYKVLDKIYEYLLEHFEVSESYMFVKTRIARGLTPLKIRRAFIYGARTVGKIDSIFVIHAWLVSKGTPYKFYIDRSTLYNCFENVDNILNYHTNTDLPTKAIYNNFLVFLKEKLN